MLSLVLVGVRAGPNDSAFRVKRNDCVVCARCGLFDQVYSHKFGSEFFLFFFFVGFVAAVLRFWKTENRF